MRRVLKPGGRFLCLEFSRPTQPWLDPVYDAYSFRVLPWLGRVVAKDEDAYRYLAESIRRFPDQQDLCERMRRSRSSAGSSSSPGTGTYSAFYRFTAASRAGVR